MKVQIVSIAKKERSIYDPLYKELIKMSERFAKIEDIELFGKSVTKAHTIGANAAKSAYTAAFEPYITNGYSIALHPDGKIIDSFEFSKLLADRIQVKFFIGGAYGLEDTFIRQCDQVVSLGRITMSHKIAKAVLLEQIYRAFSILSNHPYHK